MSEFKNVLDLINHEPDQPTHHTPDIIPRQEVSPEIYETFQPFDPKIFIDEVCEKSESKNRVYAQLSQNISAYDTAKSCIREVIYKLNNTPVESFASKWLPLSLRGVIGTAIHEWIQNTTDQFTEHEVSLKIPSIRFSGRVDNLIGPNILVEIKSCTYKDYKDIIKHNRARTADFLQALTYKHILENYIDEARDPNIKIRLNTNKPKYDNYKINKIQFIYVAHDVIGSDVENFSHALKIVDEVKKTLSSRSNHFYFIGNILYDLETIDVSSYIEYIDNKIKAINYYLENDKSPTSEDPYIDTKQCYFCLYSKMCDVNLLSTS